MTPTTHLSDVGQLKNHENTVENQPIVMACAWEGVGSAYRGSALPDAAVATPTPTRAWPPQQLFVADREASHGALHPTLPRACVRRHVWICGADVRKSSLGQRIRWDSVGQVMLRLGQLIRTYLVLPVL